MRAESHNSKTRHLGIMDICNRDSSDQESQRPGSNKAGWKKRHHGPEVEDKGEEPKPKRRQLPTSKRERQEGLSSSSPDPVARNPSNTKSDPVSETDDNATEIADDAPPPTARPRTKKARRPSGKGHHNLVEQKYRQKLNSHFKRLLEVLPAANSTGKSGNLRKPPSSVPPSPPPPPSSFLSLPPGRREVPDKKPSPSVPPPPPHIPVLLSGEREVPNSSRVRIPLPPLTLAPHEPVVVSARASLPGSVSHTRSSSDSASEQDSGTGGIIGRRVSKGDILERARLYIQALEQKHRQLMAEKMELELLWEENYKSKETGAGRKVPN